LQFHRQSVGIPTSFSFDALPFHGMIPADDILDRTGHHVVYAGLAIGRGWPFVKYKSIFRIPSLHAFLKNPLLLPKFQNGTIYIGQAELIIFLVHMYSSFESAKIGKVIIFKY